MPFTDRRLTCRIIVATISLRSPVSLSVSLYQFHFISLIISFIFMVFIEVKLSTIQSEFQWYTRNHLGLKIRTWWKCFYEVIKVNVCRLRYLHFRPISGKFTVRTISNEDWFRNDDLISRTVANVKLTKMTPDLVKYSRLLIVPTISRLDFHLVILENTSGWVMSNAFSSSEISLVWHWTCNWGFTLYRTKIAASKVVRHCDITRVTPHDAQVSLTSLIIEPRNLHFSRYRIKLLTTNRHIRNLKRFRVNYCLWRKFRVSAGREEKR